MTVSDDGEGFDVGAARQAEGLGLVSIEERARLVRGRSTSARGGAMARRSLCVCLWRSSSIARSHGAGAAAAPRAAACRMPRQKRDEYASSDRFAG